MKDDGKNALLTFWYKSHLSIVNNHEYDLSYRQMCILFNVSLSAAPVMVKELSEQIGISKPAVSRAVTALNKLTLVKRKRDQRDRRNVYIQRTTKGSAYVENIARMLKDGLRDMVKEI